MKKKALIIITILIVCVAVAVTLVGCVPSRPDRFVTKLLAAEKWAVTFKDCEGNITSINAINGNMRMDKAKDNQTFYVVGKTFVEMYRFQDETWTYECIVDESQVATLRKSILDGDASTLVINPNAPDLKYIQKDFESKYERRDGRWYERNTMPASLQIKGSSMIYEKYDTTATYTIGYKITLPKEAKQAKKDATSK